MVLPTTLPTATHKPLVYNLGFHERREGTRLAHDIRHCRWSTRLSPPSSGRIFSVPWYYHSHPRSWTYNFESKLCGSRRRTLWIWFEPYCPCDLYLPWCICLRKAVKWFEEMSRGLYWVLLGCGDFQELQPVLLEYPISKRYLWLTSILTSSLLVGLLVLCC